MDRSEIAIYDFDDFEYTTPIFFEYKTRYIISSNLNLKIERVGSEVIAIHVRRQHFALLIS
jgi:hypothetical protein